MVGLRNNLVHSPGRTEQLPVPLTRNSATRPERSGRGLSAGEGSGRPQDTDRLAAAEHDCTADPVQHLGVDAQRP